MRLRLFPEQYCHPPRHLTQYKHLKLGQNQRMCELMMPNREKNASDSGKHVERAGPPGGESGAAPPPAHQPGGGVAATRMLFGSSFPAALAGAINT